MNNNHCLRRIRYILDFSDSKMIDIFAQANQTVTRAEVSAWLKKDDDADFVECPDTMFATFLNGLINAKRGKKEGAQAVPEQRLNHNIIFAKLKIAFNLQADEILSILALADMRISKHELSAFFRRPDHKHFRKCQDQILRNFLKGLQLQFRHEMEPDELFQ
ncbi:MAG: DUF1456 family protein [Nitrospirales bacterium]|nr:MAG: DUF1456 family protein [Nitrospirales bacterium]